MSSDDSDKTVFQPSARGNPENTSMRPTPGGRPGGNVPQPGGGARNPQMRPSQAPMGSAESAVFQISRGLNPIVNAASSLIAVFEKTRNSMSHPDIGGLHQRLVAEIRGFENRLREQGFAPEIVLSARYVICSVLDETVLNTPWGSESAWAQRTLLSVFHNETSGGEKFFLILDRMRQAPADNIYMIEFMYICISLGFEGKYRLMGRGRDALEVVRDDLFAVIRRQRGEYERSLADHWQGLGNIRNTLAQYIPMWVIVVVVVSLLFFSFSGFRWWLYETSTPVASELSNITTAARNELNQKDEQKTTP